MKKTKAPKRKRAAAVACTDWLGGITREEAIVAAGFCQGLAARDGINLTEWERGIVRKAGIALMSVVIPKRRPPNDQAEPRGPDRDSRNTPGQKEQNT